MLFWNRWNQESAGRVYFNISREKPAHTPGTLHVQPLSCKLEWTNQKHFYCFFLNQSETILPQGSPELLISLFYMRRTALGRDCFSPRQTNCGWVAEKKENLKRWKVLEFSKFTHRLEKSSVSNSKRKINSSSLRKTRSLYITRN